MEHADIDNTIERVDADEKKLAEVSKHPLGIVLLYVQTAVGLLVAAGLGFFLLPTVLDSVETGLLIASIFGAVALVVALLVVIVASFIYWQNRLVVTDRNITQILQTGLFNRKVSQLNIYNVEDVTVQQKGFLSTVFNYGTLKIETAGEQENFNYSYCPNAGYYAKIILDSRERMLGQMDGDTYDIQRPIHGPRRRSGSPKPRDDDVREPIDTALAKKLGAKSVKNTTTRH